MKVLAMTPLTEVITSEQLFAYMTSLSFIPSPAVADYMDSEYFCNYSGTKQVSPLVQKWANNASDDESVFVPKLAGALLNRYAAKWEQLFARYSSLSTLNLLNNINMITDTTYGKRVDTETETTLTKSGTETNTLTGTETRTESHDPLSPRKSTREISGSYTDATNETTTRTGVQETTESFPEARKSSRVTTGGYTDTDTTKNVRTGSTLVTDKGGTTTSVYGFNTSTAVKSQTVAPDDSATGVTTETTYGTNGLVDTHSGGIARAYGTDGLKEETTETGQRKTATTFGTDGLQDALSSGTTRTYTNYKDEVTESGSTTTTISYGNGRQNETSFNNRIDSTVTNNSVENSGTDSVSESGYNYKSLIDEFLALFMSADYIDFLEIVYSDCDKLLTLPYYAV